MIKRAVFKLKFHAFILFAFLLLTNNQVQAWDYTSFPRLDYQIHELYADIVFNPANGNISGNVRYDVSPFSSDSAEFILLTEGIKSDSVLVNGLRAEFDIAEGLLQILIPENLIDPRRRIDVQVFYQTSDHSGLLRTASGTWFSSSIPLSRASWLPIVEHPTVEAQFTMRIQVPNGYTAVSNGFLKEELNGEESAIWEWRSDVKLPLSEIGFAVGEFEVNESLFGMKTVKVFKELDLIDRAQANELLRNIISHLGQTQRQFRKEYPFDGLNLILLQDHLWEPKFYQAGLGFIFMNGGALPLQAKAIADAQWFGIYHRPERWADAHSALFMQMLLAKNRGEVVTESLSDFPRTSFKYWSPLNQISKAQMYQHLDTFSSFEMNVITGNFSQLLQRFSGVVSWDEYARFWHSLSGRFITLPELSEATEIEVVSPELVNVFITYASQNRRVTFTVEPRNETEGADIPLVIKRITRTDVITDTLLVNRAGGEYSLDQTQPLQNVMIEAVDANAFSIIEMKDFPFWLHQLRNATDINRRVQAALEMPRFKEDPDIQLALTDLLRTERDTKVRAALIRSFGEIVQGAAGTEQFFIQGARNATGDELQASVEALWHYSGNSDAVSAVARVAMSSDDIKAVSAAFATFRNIATENQFRELAGSVLMGNRPAEVKAAMVSELFRAGDMNIAVDTALDILEGKFPFVMRQRAFQLLLNYEKNNELRVSIPRIANDPDPRIRALAIQHASVLQPRQMNDLLEKRYFSERDPRVRILFDNL
jgi:hypothetical protein